MTSFDFMEATVAKVHAAYLNGSLTCRALCEYYLKRIEQLESRINSIICVNPKALEEAERFADSHPDLDACFIYADEKGELRMFYTKGMDKYMTVK